MTLVLKLARALAAAMPGSAWAEAWFARHALAETAVMQALDGRQVALVGNARSLATTDFGAAIDGHDLVIRLNRAPGLGQPSHGSRADWIAASIDVPERLGGAAVDRLLWMTPKRRRVPPWALARRAVWFYPPAWHAELAARLGARPSTGAMAIDLLARSKAGKIDLYGFDFFASKSLSGSRDAAQVPHDFAAERDWALALIAADPRFTLNRAD